MTSRGKSPRLGARKKARRPIDIQIDVLKSELNRAIDALFCVGNRILLLERLTKKRGHK